ncbi:MAG: beta-lactamase family protein, partial [Thiovulaceae bacterium]|nr:beta-lactamase family protein [Sulfurimonadaceae bacterium]
MTDKLQNILDKSVDTKNIFGAVLSLESPSVSWTGSSGNIENDSSIFIASTTKLYTTTLIYQLCFEKRIDLDDKLSKYLDASILEGLHFFKGHDYSDLITIRHLISHTSGLPDYFEQKDAKGIVLLDEITSGRDSSWSFEDVIVLSKSMKPK